MTPDMYGIPLERKIAELASAATTVRFDASDMMPGAVGRARSGRASPTTSPVQPTWIRWSRRSTLPGPRRSEAPEELSVHCFRDSV